ncbi:hypothetical protein [Clostridium saccharoperbutylacetonicum]|uniref:hypothetical protein n=1 Tax=Clostridium saccharoperbutylacetonicum TaxID=36745 RepID=UPI0039EBB299
MRSSKKIYRTQQGIRKYCSNPPVPSCEFEILLILTVILFVSSGNNIKIYSKCQNESNKIKDNTIKPNITSNKIHENLSGKNSMKRYGKYQDKSSKKKDDVIKLDTVPNETYDGPTEEVKYNYNKRKCVPEFSSNINQFEKATESNNPEQRRIINDKKCDKETGNISLPVAIDKHKEKISTQNCSVENDILLVNNLNSSNINTEEKCSETLLGETLKKDYRGVMVCALLPNGITISGEVAFNFNDVVALKHNNTIIYINENYIISFY